MKLALFCGAAALGILNPAFSADSCPSYISSFKQVEANEVYYCALDVERIEQVCETTDKTSRIIRKYRSMADLFDDQRPIVNRAAVIVKISNKQGQSYISTSKFDSKNRIYLSVSNGFAHYFTAWNESGMPIEGKFILLGITPEQATIAVPFTTSYGANILTTNLSFTAELLKDRSTKGWPVKRILTVSGDGKQWTEENFGFDGTKTISTTLILSTSSKCH